MPRSKNSGAWRCSSSTRSALRSIIPISNVAEALALIARVAPREAYLTHMSHDIGLHAVTEPTLPRGVHMAYDTLQIEIND